MSDENDTIKELRAEIEAEAADEAKASDAPEEGKEQPNGVLIVKVEDEDGNIGTNTVPTGDVKATEVQTIIELGLANWRGKLGLS